MPNNNEGFQRDELILLGRIDGKLDGLKDQLNTEMAGVNDRLDEQAGQLTALDARLRTVEQKAAVLGAASGGAMALGVALIVEGAKAWWTSRGGQ
ncbi:MAG: hypothetical protein KF796_19585 [Ramlibacter sp.]|nr:hypothetical protein [Ramlibacter sp.]